MHIVGLLLSRSIFSVYALLMPDEDVNPEFS